MDSTCKVPHPNEYVIMRNIETGSGPDAGYRSKFSCVSRAPFRPEAAQPHSFERFLGT